jgi:histidine triad (HIT) family protein
MCFMTLRPTRPGECMVIPKVHVDHFIEIPTDLLAHLIEVVRRVARAVQDEFAPIRMGIVVHGFGVPHAHFILVPQHDADDITSGLFAVVEDGEIVFRHRRIPELPRDQLDQHADRLSRRVSSGAAT